MITLVWGLLAGLALAVPANASTVKVVCVLDANVKFKDKIQPGGVQLVGGGGTYTLSSVTFTCAGTAKGAPYTESMSLSSTGKFSNVVCGTGTLISGVGQTTGSGSGKVAALLPRLEYKIQLAAWQGPIHVNNDNVAPKNVPKADLNMDSTDKPAPSQSTALYEAGETSLAVDRFSKQPIIPRYGCGKSFRVIGTVIIHKT